MNTFKSEYRPSCTTFASGLAFGGIPELRIQTNIKCHDPSVIVRCGISVVGFPFQSASQPASLSPSPPVFFPPCAHWIGLIIIINIRVRTSTHDETSLVPCALWGNVCCHSFTRRWKLTSSELLTVSNATNSIKCSRRFSRFFLNP